jgi:hypothetical protein
MESETKSKMEKDSKLKPDMEVITIKRKKLTEIEQIAYNIAKKHLGSSFDYSKC